MGRVVCLSFVGFFFLSWNSFYAVCEKKAQQLLILLCKHRVFSMCCGAFFLRYEVSLTTLRMPFPVRLNLRSNSRGR